MIGKQAKEFTNGEMILLSKISSLRRSDFYLIYLESKDPHSQINKDIWNLIIFFINKEDELRLQIVNQYYQLEINLKIENEEIIEAIDKETARLKKFLEDETVNLQTREETTKQINQLEQLKKKRSQLVNEIDQLWADIKALTITIAEKKKEIRTLISERDEKVINLLEDSTQEIFQQIEDSITKEPIDQKRTEKREFLKNVKEAYAEAREYQKKENLQELLKLKDQEVTPERVLHEQAIHRHVEFMNLTKKVTDSHLFPKIDVKVFKKRAEDYLKKSTENINHKKVEVANLEKSREEKEEQLKEKNENLKKVDRTLQTLGIKMPQLMKEQTKLVDTEALTSLLSEADQVFEKIDNLDPEMNEEEIYALKNLNDSMSKIRGNVSMSATENLDILLAVLNDMKTFQKNPSLWAVVSSLTTKLTRYFPEDNQPTFHPQI